ncbi:putative signal peptide-containing protein [Cryptosporidium canis]|uniref:Signal peptide-containing protein n=1 Tax=Cryptosporidium canis TaxID=195482 RepID=A0A9D5DKS8_9CRYT|nr:putative signal peptide-containing protein [Cryptosporidium canis]
MSSNYTTKLQYLLIGVLLVSIVHALIFDQAKTDWIFSRQADAWLANLRSYSTIYEYSEIEGTPSTSHLFSNYKTASNESMAIFEENLERLFDYFFYGFGVEVVEFATQTNTTVDENDSKLKRINRKKIMDRLRQKTQPRNNVRTLKEEGQGESEGGPGRLESSFYWPNETEKWARIRFIESGAVTETNFTMTTYRNETGLLANPKEVTLVFEVLEDNAFRWGGNYICQELVQEQLSTEATPPSYVPGQTQKANVLARKGQTLWYGFLVTYPEGKMTNIGSFASSAPETTDEMLLMHIFSRYFAFSEPFTKQGKYAEIGHYDGVLSIISDTGIISTGRKFHYLKTATISSPSNPGLVVPPKFTGSVDKYPSKHDPYDFQDPLGPLFVPGKHCSEFLLNH